MVNRELLAQYLETVMTATTAPNPITASDQVWMFKDIGMIIQFSGADSVAVCVSFSAPVYETVFSTDSAGPQTGRISEKQFDVVDFYSSFYCFCLQYCLYQVLHWHKNLM